MNAIVRVATLDDRQLLDRLLDLYLHDFSEFDGRELAADGSYHYRWLDAYWSDKDRVAYLVHVDDHPAGFALVRLTDPIEMAEFFVLRKYRRAGIGSLVARQVIGAHPGRWRIEQVERNTAATAFWRRAIPTAFEEHTRDDGHVEQRFMIRPS